MYLNILKKDLKRKKTMNIILFLFIIMAATFISSSCNNLLAISNAMNDYFEKSQITDYNISVFEAGNEKTKEFVNSNKNVKNYIYAENVILNQDCCKLNNGKFDYANTIAVGGIENTGYEVFDKDNNKISDINDGDIMLPSILQNDLGIEIGDIITIQNGDYSKDFKFVGSTKDILYGSNMVGMTRLIVNQKDYEDISKNGGLSNNYYYGVKTDDIEKIAQDFSKTGIPTFAVFDVKLIKNMYIMDMVIAGVMLIVSICLILISIVILRFTIVFTLSEEFREIGVMKAIGINNRKIRGIYIVKYFAISLIGSAIGFFAGIPFAKMMLQNVSKNIVVLGSGNILINLVSCILIVAVVLLFCYLSTSKVKKASPIDAIRNGSNGERFKRKGFLTLNKSRMSPVSFLALNDILSGLKRFGVMIVTFTLGIILIIVPIMTMATLQSENLVSWFAMVKSDVYIPTEALVQENDNRQDVVSELENVQKTLEENNIPCEVYKEILFKFSIEFGEKATNSMAFQGTGISVDKYTYSNGTPPQNADEVAITHIVADKIGAKIGDTVKINVGDEIREFLVTAVYQSMTNNGEGIRFHQDADIDYSYSMGQFGTQIKYTDNPSEQVIKERFKTIKKLFPENEIQTGGEYISDMIGDVSDSMKGLRNLIVIVVLTINILVTVLMMKSFITKEKGEIGMLKAIGFRNSSIIRWQTMRIGIVLVISIILGTVLSNPVAQISSGQVFKMMGASSIEFEVNPLEVYVFYPILVLVVTLMASFISAQQVRKISASETSNIE